jgi:hypothetical protein
MKDLKQLWQGIKKEYVNCISFNNFIAHSFVLDFSIEKRFLPIFIDGKKVQFTNVDFHELSNGNDYYLVLIGNNYKFLKYSYEPDCDGAYYDFYIIDMFDIRNDNYQVREVYTNEITKILQNY